MPAAQPSPLLRRRRLGVDLRRLREAAGLTGDQVIERVGWASASKLSRLENGRSRPDLDDIRGLLTLYGATEAQRAEIMTIALEALDVRKWLRSYTAMTPRQRAYAELEAGCAQIREYGPVIVPGLLQTAEYARVRILSSRPIAVAPEDPEAQENGNGVDDEVAARMARQKSFNRETDAPRYAAVIEEAVLGRRAGPAEVLRKQAAQLRRLAMLPNVTIQVLPREVPIADWYLPHTAFSLYRFTDPQDPETVAVEGLSTNLVLTERDEIFRYNMVFEWLQAAALTAEDTLSWLTDAAGQRSGGRASTSVHGPVTPPTRRSPDTTEGATGR